MLSHGSKDVVVRCTTTRQNVIIYVFDSEGIREII